MDRQEKLENLKINLEDNIKEFLKNSDELKNFLKFCKENFRKYSIKNRLLIYSQNRAATFIAGFKKWRELGYIVKKGEKARYIFAPILNEEKELKKFIFVPVFDDTQVMATENATPLPEIDTSFKKTKDCKYNINSLFKIVKDLIEEKIGKNIIFYSNDSREEGMTDGKNIYIKKKEKISMLGTLIHEYIHYNRHFQGKKLSKNEEEVEAELGAIIFGSIFNLNINKKYGYLYFYERGVDLREAFENVLENIENLTDEIINKINLKVI
ncbi:ArdC family protein [Fusobacterium polymorphum]|uniref:ArdC family protein n=1 Tax=Fusobacterium nucleatum subsp. polymorphum TaxID=76857 RepID=UPI00300A7FBB